MSHTDDLQHLRSAVLAIAQQLPLDSARHDALYVIAFAAAEALHIEAANRGELREALLRWVQPTPLEQAGDWLYPNGDRPTCLNGDGRPVYLAGLCGTCYASKAEGKADV